MNESDQESTEARKGSGKHRGAVRVGKSQRQGSDRTARRQENDHRSGQGRTEAQRALAKHRDSQRGLESTEAIEKVVKKAVMESGLWKGSGQRRDSQATQRHEGVVRTAVGGEVIREVDYGKWIWKVDMESGYGKWIWKVDYGNDQGSAECKICFIVRSSLEKRGETSWSGSESREMSRS